MLSNNVSFPKIQIQNAVQPDGNHSFLRVKRAMASYSPEPALPPPPLQVVLGRTGRPPGASSNHKNGRPALYVLLRSERSPRMQKNVKDTSAIRSSSCKLSSSPILINAYKLSHYPETHVATREHVGDLHRSLLFLWIYN